MRYLIRTPSHAPAATARITTTTQHAPGGAAAGRTALAKAGGLLVPFPKAGIHFFAISVGAVLTTKPASAPGGATAASAAEGRLAASSASHASPTRETRARRRIAVFRVSRIGSVGVVGAVPVGRRRRGVRLVGGHEGHESFHSFRHVSPNVLASSCEDGNDGIWILKKWGNNFFFFFCENENALWSRAAMTPDVNTGQLFHLHLQCSSVRSLAHFLNQGKVNDSMLENQYK